MKGLNTSKIVSLPLRAWSALLEENVAKVGRCPSTEIHRLRAYYRLVERSKLLPLGSKGIPKPGIFLQGYKDQRAYLSYIYPNVSSTGKMIVAITVVSSNNQREFFDESGDHVKLESYGDDWSVDDWLAFYDKKNLRQGMGRGSMSGYVSVPLDMSMDDETDDINTDDDSSDDVDDRPVVASQVRHTLEEVYQELVALRDDLAEFCQRR